VAGLTQSQSKIARMAKRKMWGAPFWAAAVLLRGAARAQRTLLIRQIGVPAPASHV
jgi:hypothetical protein